MKKKKFFLKLIAVSAGMFSSCHTTGDPDRSTGFFDWNPFQSGPEVIDPRRRELAHEQEINADLRQDRRRLQKRLAEKEEVYKSKLELGSPNYELSKLQSEISSLKSQLRVLAAGT